MLPEYPILYPKGESNSTFFRVKAGDNYPLYYLGVISQLHHWEVKKACIFVTGLIFYNYVLLSTSFLDNFNIIRYKPAILLRMNIHNNCRWASIYLYVKKLFHCTTLNIVLFSFC